MALNMDLIVFAQTGHVLAGALRNQTGGAGPTVKELAGEGVWLRNPSDGTLQLIVDAEHLGIASTPFRDDVLLAARRFQMVDGLPEAKDENTTVNPVVLNGTNVTVSLPVAVTSNIDVWVVVTGSNISPIVQKVEVLETATSGSEPLPLQSGTYQVLVLAPGYRTFVEEVAF